MAEVTSRGAVWSKSKLTGDEIQALMRWHHKTIAELSFRMGITQKRIGEVRHDGLDNPLSVRDWVEAITGDDVGPLPERYRISNHREECQCWQCGCPLYVGDFAYEYVNAVYCSLTCCRQSRGSRKEAACLH